MIDQNKIHNLCLSKDSKERFQALKLLRYNFLLLSDKQQVWNDIIQLAKDEDSDISYDATSFLGILIAKDPDSQESRKAASILSLKIRNQYFSNDEKERIQALKLLRDYFSLLPDKQQILNDVIILVNDPDSDISYDAASALGILIAKDPDSQKSYEAVSVLSSKIHNQCLSSDAKERIQALKLLRDYFSLLPDKQQTYNDIIQLTKDEDSNISYDAISFLGILIAKYPNSPKNYEAASVLSSKIHNQCLSKDAKERFQALKLLRYNFLLLSDKQQIWNDIIQLAKDEDSNISYDAASVLLSALSEVPDKQQAWNDLLELTSNQNSYVKWEASTALGSAFKQAQDKQKAWDDLHSLTKIKDVDVKRGAAKSLGFAFPHVPDKQQAGGDLHRLACDPDVGVRRWTASSLGTAFPHVSDKQQVEEDLHRLTSDQDVDVRKRTASSLGSAFPYLLDKKQAWEDLIKMAKDKNKEIAASANYSLGKASIFRASQAENENDLEQELKKALEFYGRAAQESSHKWLNPSVFCLPFYQLFYTIVFEKKSAKEEVDKYLAEAKDAVQGSKIKELLFEAITNLAEALKEVQNSKRDFKEQKSELNLYRKYCDRAAELMKDTEESAPFASMAMRKGLPILDRNLKELLEEIQEKAKIACQVSQSTQTQEIAIITNKKIQEWEISSSDEMNRKIDELLFVLESKIPHMPENEEILSKIKSIREENDISKKIGIISYIIQLIPSLHTK